MHATVDCNSDTITPTIRILHEREKMDDKGGDENIERKKKS